VAKFDRVAEARRETGEKRAQAIEEYRAEPRRQLDEQRAELVAERRDPVEEGRDLGRAVEQQLVGVTSRGNLKQNRNVSGTCSRQRATVSGGGNA
jgi:hypothetical protein